MSYDLFFDGVEPSADDVIIAVMGMTGAGKSSFISLCSDKKPPIGHDLNSCTQSVDTYPFLYGGPPQRKIFLVDTPGFDDSYRSDTEVLRGLAAWLSATYARGTRLSGIVYLHRINQPRMPGSARRNIMMFNKLCGDGALKNVILATTMWDLVDQIEGAAREKQLIETKEFWGYMASKGSKVYRHDNTRRSAMNLIGHFVKTDTRVTLGIQEEMVDQQKNLDGTAAGSVVETTLQKELARCTQELRDLENEQQEALRRKEHEILETISEMRAESRAELAQIQEMQESLRVSTDKLYQERYAQLEKMIKERSMAYNPELGVATRKLSSVNLIDTDASSSTGPPHTHESLLASGSTDGIIRIWDPAMAECKASFKAHSSLVKSLSWSHDGTRLASVGDGNKIKIWDLTGRRLQTLESHRQPIFSTAWSPKGARLASFGIRGQSSTCRHFNTTAIAFFVCSRDEVRFASRSSLGTIKIWNAATRKWTLLDDSETKANALAWSPDGTQLASGFGRNLIKIWDPEVAECVITLGIPDQQVAIQSLAWSHSPTRFATGYYRNNIIEVWYPDESACKRLEDQGDAFSAFPAGL
ncbi:uncharacterized protein E0L32_002349 [Thyridium curvatum]|uniref:Mitochondrial division protein 1 n=1 Tax=Thyridium curvatum TaxID=1093900 RepID=A0A507AIA3_9PEZI|nr:uncharacterized protein E0L32_002349 [Thyridium curvatum]TPX06853.1 hypothetical protein E0L32_002349 [Thyridium curvatum]